MVREWDPRTASSAEIASLLDTLNAVLAADLPQDPPWRESSLREYLAEVMPGERRISWVAQAEPAAAGEPGAILGHVHVLLLGDIGVLEVLVHPSARRTGLGRDLVLRAARRVYQEGFRSIGVEVVGDTPAVAFLRVARLHPGVRGDAQRARPDHGRLGRRWPRWPPASAPATTWSSARAARRTT